METNRFGVHHRQSSPLISARSAHRGRRVESQIRASEQCDPDDHPIDLDRYGLMAL
jgi:hypothetical protein